MSKIVSGSLIVIITGLILSLNSCTPQACFDETESFLKATLYDYNTKKILAPDSLSMSGLNMTGSKIYNKSQGITVAQFPLNASTDTSVFMLEINGITDTIEFRYTSYPHLISKECGYTFYHILDTAFFTKHNIDSIFIKKDLITTLYEENIRIYY